ncbi:hypothetical protein ACTXT7_003432 [Hymenolepis weldensis]
MLSDSLRTKLNKRFSTSSMPCNIKEFTNALAYQKYMEHAANYVKEKKEIANVQKEIDDLLNVIIERSRVPESDQVRAKQMMLLYAEMGK